DLLQDSGDRTWHLGIDFVRLDLDQRLVALDAVAGLLQPAANGPLGDRFAELRHLHNGVRHGPWLFFNFFNTPPDGGRPGRRRRRWAGSPLRGPARRG